MLGEEVGIDPAGSPALILNFDPPIASRAGCRTGAVHAQSRSLKRANDGICNPRRRADVEHVIGAYKDDGIRVVNAGDRRQGCDRDNGR